MHRLNYNIMCLLVSGNFLCFNTFILQTVGSVRPHDRFLHSSFYKNFLLAVHSVSSHFRIQYLHETKD